MMAEGLDDIEMQVVVSESTEQPNSPLPPKPVISLDQAAGDGSEDVVQVRPEEFSSLPPSPSPVDVVPKPVISLHQAARDGSEDVVRQLMDVNNSEVDAYDSEDYTAFHYAAQHHNLSMMKLLVYYGADPKQHTRTRSIRFHACNALHLAAGAGSKYKPGEQDSQAVKETMQFLVDKGLDINVTRGGFEKSVLYFAKSSGNEAAVEFLLDQKNQFNGNSVLHDACTTSNVELLKLLLEELKKRCQLSDMLAAKNRDRQTPLEVALAGHQGAMANKLLEFASNDEYADVRFDPHLVLDYSQGRESDAVVEFLRNNVQKVSIDSDGVTILHLAAARGWVKAAIAIDTCSKPSLLNKKDNDGRTPLHYAAGKNNCEIIDFLMEQEDSDVDTADKDGYTPLMVAARAGSTVAFAKLLEKADVGKIDNQLMTVVLAAEEAGHSAILRTVDEKYPDFLKQRTLSDNTPLHAATESGGEKSVKMLLDKRADVNARNEYKRTPLHLAAWNGHNGVVKMLLAYKPPSDVETDEQLATVDISARDYDSNTALHLAAEGGHCSVADTLTCISKGASVRARNVFDQTPLHLAAQGGHQEMVELLVSKHHAAMDAKDIYQAFYYAVREGHSDVVTLLQNRVNSAELTSYRRNALQLAIEKEDDVVAKAILKQDNWKITMRHTFRLGWRREGPQTTSMRELIKKMPEVAMEVLTKSIAKHEDPHSDAYTVEYDYELLEDLGKPGDAGSNESVSPRRCGWYRRPSQLLQRLTSRSKGEGLYTEWGPSGFDVHVASHPLVLIVKHKRTEMLNHPLVSTLLDYKWKRALPLYLANVLFYLVFLIFFTAYALVLPNPQSELCLAVSNQTFANASVECGNGSNATAIQCGVCSSDQPFLYTAGAIVLLCVLVRVIMELIQFLEQPKRYFLNHENWLEIFLYSLTLIFMSSLGGTCVCPKPWQWQIGTLAVFLAWIHLSIFVKKLPLFGLYIIMFEGIVITFIKIAIPALLLVLAFSMAFYMMFFVPSPLFAASPFATPGLSIIKAMTMAVGEMEFESMFRLTSGGVFDIDEVPTPIPYTGVSILLWIFFLILMPILLMNLLTGLAVGDVDRIQSDAEFKKFELQINLVLKIEEAFQAFRTWFIPPKKEDFNQPNKHRQRKRFLSLLTGVDKYRTGEDIHNSLSKPVKYIEIGHVHEQTTTLLAKQQEVAKLNSKQRKEIAELKEAIAEQRTEICMKMSEQLETAMAKQRTEISMKMSDKLKITMAQQRIEISMKMNDQLETAMDTQRILQREEMAEQKEEMAAMRAAMDEQTDMMKELLKLRGAEGREEEGRASPAQS